MAAYSKTLVLLANSCKNGGRCFAGKEVVDGRVGAWVRPTGAGFGGAIQPFEQRLADGTLPGVLDVVEVALHRPDPTGFQSENHRIASGLPWSYRGRLSRAALHRLVDPCATLWLNGFSSAGGCNDRIPEDQLERLDTSLCFIGPVAVTLSVGAGKVRASFHHRQVRHDLCVTDPTIKAAYAACADDWYPLGEAFICASLAPVWNGYAYKLAAAIMTPQAD